MQFFCYLKLKPLFHVKTKFVTVQPHQNGRDYTKKRTTYSQPVEYCGHEILLLGDSC